MKEYHQRVTRALTICTLGLMWAAPILLFWLLGEHVRGLPMFEYLSVTFGVCAWALLFGFFVSWIVPKILDKN